MLHLGTHGVGVKLELKHKQTEQALPVSRVTPKVVSRLPGMAHLILLLSCKETLRQDITAKYQEVKTLIEDPRSKMAAITVSQRSSSGRRDVVLINPGSKCAPIVT